MTHDHHHRRAVALAANLMLIACGGASDEGGGGGTADGGGSGGADVDERIASLPICVLDGQEEPPHMDITGAEYSVPVVPAELEPHASYPIDEVSLCRRPSGLELGYSLPALLVGKKTRVSFAGGLDPATGTYELSSEDGTASCDPQGAWSCLEKFTGIEVDLEEVAEEASGLSPAEAQARIDVAQIFQGDPIGVLDFSLP